MSWIHRAAAMLSLSACGGVFDLQREGQRCTRTEECAPGLICAHEGTCQPEGAPGTSILGQPCSSNAECRFGLVCSSEGSCAEPGAPGTAAFGERCDETNDCQRGLTCEEGTCLGFQVPFWPGAACPDPDADPGPFRLHWSLSDDLPTFYDHPFPDDTRWAPDGTLDLSAHPTPGPLIELLGDVPRRIADEASRGLGGFGPNQAVFLRLSAYPDPSTIRFGVPGLDSGSIAVVDLSDEDATDVIHPFGYEISSGRTPYLCHNWLAVYPTDGRPYRPGHTYAVLLGANIRSDADGSTLARTEALSATLADTAPTGAREAAAWEAYAPLRAWMSRAGVNRSDLGGAAVFTIQDVERRPSALYATVEASDLPALTDAISCGAGADDFADPSDPSRGCSPPDERFSEVQGLMPLPRFQAGTPPFKEISDGGAIAIQDERAVVVQEDLVHVALSLPKGLPPESGWPLVIYGHGTGGAYSSAIREGLAGALADASFDGQAVPFATLGFDAPLHGPRSFPANHDEAWLSVSPRSYDPDILFFNPLNPLAARDNLLQLAADVWMLSRWAAEVGVTEDASPTGAPIPFDPDRIYYLGHSQGGVVGPLVGAWDERIPTLALSGAGGLTLRSLLGKTSPNDLPALLRVGLADGRVDRAHPILNLVQMIADGSDGVNFAEWLTRRPRSGQAFRDVLMISGEGDTYTPDATQYALARAMVLGQIAGDAAPFDILPPVEPPVSGNVGGGRTGVVARYRHQSRDPHFVLFDQSEVLQRVASYFASAALEGVPTVE